MATLDYRLIIRNKDNTADELTFDTLPGANCFTLAAPQGDGQSFDPIAGTFVIGSYTYQVIDAVTDPDTSTRAVSSYMADPKGRYRLVSRIALVYFSADRGSTWEAYASGFVNRNRKTSALLYEFTIGDAQRVEKAITLFTQKSGSFDKMSCLVGGPVIGGFGPIRDYGPWVMITKAFYASKVVQFHFVSGFVRHSVNEIFMSFPTGGFMYTEGDYTSYEESKVNALADPFRQGTPNYKDAGIGYYYPRLEARVEDADGTLIGVFTVLNGRDPAYTIGGGWAAGDMHAILSGGDLCLDWATTGTNPNTGAAYPTQPTLHQNVRIAVYALDVTETTPVHVTGHPVEIAALAYTDNGIAFDATSVSDTTVAIGEAIQVALRPTKSMTLDAFITSLCAMFGFSVRQSNGVRFFFATRIRASTTPALTCSINELSDPGGVIFDQDEKSIINKVTVSLEHYDLWAPETFGKDTSRPIDELVTTLRTVSVSPDPDDPDLDAADLTVHEQTYTLQGEIFALVQPILFGHAVPFLGAYPVELNEQDFVLAMATGAGSILDRRQRGAIVGELRIVRGTTPAAAQLGDEIYCTVPWQQNKNGIGGNRIVQITKRTENPGGPVFAVEDSGTTAQPATLPTFTFAKDSSTDPKRYALITITNASALLTEGDNVRIEWGVGATSTSYMLAAILTPAQLTAGRTVLRLPRMDAGSVVTVRIRSELTGIRPSTYTSPLTVTLDALSPPTSLSIIGQAGDDSIAVVSWVLGETDVPIEVRFRVHGAVAWRTVIVPAGSVNVAIATLELSTEYDFDVRHHEAPPYNGVSTSISDTFTTGSTARTLLPPDNPSAFSGSFDTVSGAFVNDGTYGLEVTALEFPETIEFEVAIEDSPGAGTYGAYVDPGRAIVSAAQQPSRTRWTGMAPSDGLRRRLHARAVRVGATSSDWCDAVDVLPWVPQQPTDFPVPAPAITLAYQTIQQGGAALAVIAVNFATPTQSQYGDMEYKVRSRIPAGTWSSFTRVPGSKAGPDTIPAQFGLDFEVTPVTITMKDGVRSTDGVAVTLTIPAGVADGTLSATADADSMNHTVTPNAIASSYRVYSKSYTSMPGTIPDTVEDPVNYQGPDRDITLGYFELPVDATNTARVTTVVFYDHNGVRGGYHTAHATRVAGATPPGTPTESLAHNAANNVQVAVTFDGAAAVGDVASLLRGGVQILTHTLTSGEATANTYTFTDTTAVGGASYSYTAMMHRLSDGLFSSASSALAVTVAAGGTLNTPGTPSTAIDSGDPCGSFLVTPVDTSGNPAGTVYDIYTCSTSGGTYAVHASGVALGAATSVPRAASKAVMYAKTKAVKTGYTTSAFSAAGSIAATPSGTVC